MLNVECCTAHNVRGTRGFTLIEILIVVVIIALTSSIALPGFVRTMQGAQLRTASRTVLMGHKYARSTAVLRQAQLAMLLDKETLELEIVVMKEANADRDKFLDSRSSRDMDSMLGAEEEESDVSAIDTELVRSLGKEVKISSFQSEHGGQEYGGVYWIMYYPNGMSDGFELVLADKNNRSVEISSDPVSGKVEAEFSKF